MSTKHVQSWRSRTKERIITAFGGKCGICGYNKGKWALQMHHLDPDEKEFSLAAVRGWPTAWNSIVGELRKCVMLCSNCHSEVHEGITKIPKDVARFDEQYADYKEMERLERLREMETPCGVCGTPFYNSRGKYCSQKCAKIASRRVVRPSREELEAMLKIKSVNQVAKDYNVTWHAVKKWLK
jgi:predicted nucleic acid-binding Zn ribbon protein